MGAHKFVNFTDRVSAIRIDPIRRTGQTRNVPDAANADSLFRASLERWNELNLATSYTDFSRPVNDLSRSLPLVLHNQAKIFALLENALVNADQYNAESMFDLLVQFARDLGEDFEPYYGRSLAAIVAVVRQNQSTDALLGVVEQAFNALAYLFKYLARLLSSNLVPTYETVLPLFGGDAAFRPRGFVLRFAAESLGFLVRRAGSNLDATIDHIVAASAVAHNRTRENMLESTTLLLSTTLKGPGTTLHSKTPQLVAAIYTACSGHSELFGRVLVETLHHVRQETSQVLYEAVVAQIVAHAGQPEAAQTNLTALTVLGGLRKGDRVPTWEPLFSAFAQLKAFSNLPEWSEMAAVLLAFGDVRNVAKHLKTAQGGADAQFRVLETLSKLSPEAYKLVSSQLWPSEGSKPMQALLAYDVRLRGFTATPPLLTSSEINVNVADLWWQAELGFDITVEERQRLLDKVSGAGRLEADIFAKVITSDLIEANIEKMASMEFAAALMTQLASAVLPAPIQPTVNAKALVKVRSVDPKEREAALNLLARNVADPAGLLDHCRVINSLPVDLANARSIGQRLRSLVLATRAAGPGDARTAAVLLVFGMLTAKLQPVVSAALESVAALGDLEPDVVSSTAMAFVTYEAADDAVFDVEVVQKPPLNCHTLAAFGDAAGEAVALSGDVDTALRARMAAATREVTHDELRLVGFRALGSVPKQARRVADDLVPYLTNSPSPPHLELNFSEKLSILSLFSTLPAVHTLPAFPQVYASYLYFLRSRHTPLQKLAVKCVLALSESRVLRKYRETWDALLDDKRFRDELTAFLSVGADETAETSLHPDDRATVMPFLVRILYGRAQNSGKRNLRQAVMTSLPFLGDGLRMFMELANDHLDASLGEPRRVQGYLALVSDAVSSLRGGAEPVVPLVVDGLMRIAAATEPVPQPLTDPLTEVGVSTTHPKSNDISEDESASESENDEEAAAPIEAPAAPSPGGYAAVNRTLTLLLTSVPSAPWHELLPPLQTSLVDPQLPNFAQRSRETVPGLMRLILAASAEPALAALLRSSEVLGALETLAFEAKDGVVGAALEIALNMASNAPNSAVTKQALEKLSEWLPGQLERELSAETFTTAVELVLKLLGENSLTAESVERLARASLKALGQPSKRVPLPTKARVLEALSVLFRDARAPESLVRAAYAGLAPLFRQFVAREARENLAANFAVFGARVAEFGRVGPLMVELNSYDATRLGEPDFERRSAAFEAVNEGLWTDLTATEWLPLVYSSLFFMRDPEEAALRNNGKFTLMRFLEAAKAGNTGINELCTSLVLPAIKKGLRDQDDKFRRLYIDLLSQCAHSRLIPSLEILLYDGDEEADFFVNIGHVQNHRRRRAVQRLRKHASEFETSTIAHYLLSIVEALALKTGSKDAEANNLADDALHAITDLLKHVVPGQFKSVARRWVHAVGQDPEPHALRRHVRLVTAVSQATPEGLGGFVTQTLVSPLFKILSSKSNEHENLPDRVPLALPITYFLKSLPVVELEAALPGKLTALCQLLRSKVPEMRDNVRQTLARVVRVLGPPFLAFTVAELAAALRRGGLQSHVLGYTVHSILAELDRSGLKPGDTDASAGQIFRIVMNDTFGSLGDEKDSEGYTTTAKEVKQHRSFDTAELLAKYTSLSEFGKVVEPLREHLARHRLTSKSKHKVEEVLRKLAAGLHRNADAAAQPAVVLGYEIYRLGEAKSQEKRVVEGALAARLEAAKESEKFFKVRLSSREEAKHAANLSLLQTFALDTLRSVLTSTAGGDNTGKGLLTVPNAKGLMPIVLDALGANDEDLNLAALKLATTLLRLPVNFADNSLEVVVDRCLHFVESSLDTTSNLSQSALKLLTLLVRTKTELEFKPGAIAYILERIKPDLEEPERQATAVAFIRATLLRRVVLPQVYDAGDALGRVLVTNPSESVRASCRSAYVQFLTTFPLGQTRLDRHLAGLTANLRYATAAGRGSALAAFASLLHKTSVDALEAHFVAVYSHLVLIAVADDAAALRQEALEVIKELLNTTSASVGEMKAMAREWLRSSNDLLVRGGFEVAKIAGDSDLNEAAAGAASKILAKGAKDSQMDVDWQLIYLALDAFDVGSDPALVENVLLFPHPWVRSRAARTFGQYFTSGASLSPDLLQRLAKKFVRMLGAPRLTQPDSLQLVKNINFVTNKVGYEEEGGVKWLVTKLSSLVRSEISAADLVGSKTGAIQIFASLPQLVPSALGDVAYDVILSLYVLVDQLNAENKLGELRDTAEEALGLYDEALGTTQYFRLYSEAKRFVESRRRERRSKRSIEMVTDPQLAAKKKMKRNKK